MEMTSEQTKVRSEDTPVYGSVDTGEDRRQQEIIDEALAILMLRLREPHQALESPDQTRVYLTLKLAEKEREHFCVLFLDNRHRVIEFESLFEGTIDGCSVHPREVVKRALQLNCAAVILAHNHPSGIAEPSRADITLTRRLVDALALVDVRVLDHIVIGHGESVSFAERGLI